MYQPLTSTNLDQKHKLPFTLLFYLQRLACAVSATGPKWRDMTIARLPKETEESSVSLRILGGLEEVPNKEEDTLLFLQVPYSLMARLIPAESLHFDKQISIVNDFVHRCQVNL